MGVSFEEFVSRRLTELLRFAVVLCGDPGRAEGLVVDAVCRAFDHWSDVLVIGRPFAVVRTAVVRRYLAVDARPAAVANSTDARSALDALTPARRAVLVLNIFSGQTEAEIAGACRRDPADVADDLAAALDALATAGADSAMSLLNLLDDLADDASVEPDHAVATIDGLLSAGGLAPSTASVLELFGTAPVDPPGQAVVDAGARRAAASTRPTTSATRGVDDPGSGGLDPRDAPTRPSSRRAPGEWGTPARLGVLLLAVVVAVTLTVTASRDRRSAMAATASPVPVPPSPTAQSSAPAGALSSAITVTLPGGRVLGQYFGSGSRTVGAGTRTVAAGRELAMNAVCSGTGSAVLGAITFTRCDGVPLGVVVTTAQARSVRVTADASTTWRFVLVDQPARQTDGALASPASRLLSSAAPTDRVVSAFGTGAATLQLASGTIDPRVENVRLLLTCSGSGVSFSSADSRFDGAYTRTCFSGWSYEFDVSGAALPGTLRVRASTTTSWRLAVVRG